MMAPAGSNGDAGPTSTTKPLSFSVLIQFTFVPTFTQKSELPFAFGMLGVTDAESARPFHVYAAGIGSRSARVSAVHNCAGFTSMQAYLLLD